MPPQQPGIVSRYGDLVGLDSLGAPQRLEIRHLEALDHMEVQRELGEWDWAGARYG